MAGADIELLFGVAGGGDVSGKSGRQIKQDLDSILSQINKDPLKVDVELNPTSITNFKKQVTELTDIVKAEAAKVKSAYAGLKLPTMPANKDSTAVLKNDTTEYFNAIKRVEAARTSLQKKLKQWKSTGLSDDISTKGDYEILERQVKEYNAIQAGLEAGTMKARDFEHQMSKVGATVEKASASMETFGKAKNLETYKKQLSQVTNLLEQTKGKLDNWTKAKSGRTSGSYAALEGYVADLEKLRELLILNDKGDDSVPLTDFDRRFREISHGIKTSSADIRGAGEDVQSFGDKIASIGQKLGIWISFADVMRWTVRQVRQMIEEVREIDTAMTELRKVTDETDATYSKFLDKASVRAKSLGSTVSDVVSSSADFARLGHNLEDASTLADVAIVYKNVGDGISDIETASSSIISTMQAFGTEASDAMLIVDKFNAVGNNFAISSAGIGDALLNSAASLAAAGNTIDESVAMIAAANTTIQNPEKVGTALKTVSMHIRAAKTEAEEAGISTEYMANSVSELRDEILALTGHKVDIMEDADAGKYKSTVQILRELADIWDDLQDTTRTNITEMLGGGVRNANVVSSLISNFGIVEKALEVSMGSAGSALEENEKYLDSINGKIAQFQAAFESLSTTTINSDFLKGVIDSGTTLLDILTQLIDKIGALPTLLGGASILAGLSTEGNILSPFRKDGKGGISIGDSFSTKDLTAIKNYRAELVGLDDAFKKGVVNQQGYSNGMRVFNNLLSGTGSASLEKYVQTLGDAKATAGGYIKFALKQAGANAALTASQIALNAVYSAGITLLASLITAGISYAANYWDNLNAKAQESAQTYNELSDSLEGYGKEISDIFSDLDSGNLSREEEYTARSRLLEIQNELIANYGAEAEGINLVSASAKDAADSFNAMSDAILGAEANKNLTENAKIINRAIKEMESTRFETIDFLDFGKIDERGLSEISKVIEKYDQFLLDSYKDEYGNTKWALHAKGDVQELEEAYVSLSAELRSLDKRLEADGIDIDDAFIFGGSWETHIANKLKGLDKVSEKYQETYNNAIQWKIAAESYVDANGNLQSYNSLMNDASDAQANFQKALIGTYSSEEERAAAVSASLERIAAIKEQIGSIEFAEDDLGVRDYFLGFFNSIQSLIDGEQLRVDIQATVNGTSPNGAVQDIINELNDFKGSDGAILELDIKNAGIEAGAAISAAGGVVTDEVLASMSEGARKYYELEEACKRYGTTVDSFIAQSKQLGFVQSNTSGELEQAATTAQKLQSKLKTLWDSEGFKDSRTELEQLAKASGAITPEKIEELASESEDLAKILETDGMTAEYLASVLGEVAAGNDGLALIADDALKLSRALDGMSQSFDSVTAAKQRYDSAMSVPEKDTDFKSYAEAFAKLNAEFEAGTTNSNAFWAAAEFLFGADQLEDWGWTDGIESIRTAMESNISVFSDAESAGTGFIEKMYQMSEAGQLINENGEKLVEITKNADGSFDFNIDADNIGLVAQKMGMTEEAALACLKALSMFGDIDFYNINEVADVLHETGIAFETLSGKAIDTRALETYMRAIGRTRDIRSVVSKLEQMGYTMVDVGGSAEELAADLVELGVASNIDGEINIDAGSLASLLHGLGVSKDEAIDLVNTLSSIPDINIDPTAAIEAIESCYEPADSAAGAVTSIGDAVAATDGATLTNLQAQLSGVQSYANSAASAVMSILDAITLVNSTPLNVSGGVPGRKNAHGTKYSPAGDALVGEEGPELWVPDGRARIVGAHGPEVISIGHGDQIWTASQTKRIMQRSGKSIEGSIPAFAGGLLNTIVSKIKNHYNQTTAANNAVNNAMTSMIVSTVTTSTSAPSSTKSTATQPTTPHSTGEPIKSFNNLTGTSTLPKDVADALTSGISGSVGGNVPGTPSSGSSGGRGGGGYSGGGSSGSSGGSGNSSGGSSFEDLYKKHQHLRAMDKEELEEYLEWLEGAYKKAYDSGEIELDDYRKYEEEVYDGRKELFEDYLNDVEHNISILEHTDGNENTIINLYQQAMDEISKKIEEAKAYGLDENHEYVQELQSQWYDYADEIDSIQEDITDAAMDAVEELIDFRIDMLKQDLENEKDSLNDRLDSLKDFYNKQRDLLQEQRDEEKYLEERAEKRRTKEDIEMEISSLERDNSAWAQRRILELREELNEAEKDLTEFEKDHALDTATKLLDKLEEQQTLAIETQVEALEQKLNDPKALYNQALSDIRNNTSALFEAMVDYNAKYGDGRDETVGTLWSEASNALDIFLAVFGKKYKDIDLVDIPGLSQSGYYTGTKNATAGVHRVDEYGPEAIFTSSDGSKYRVFSGDEMVLKSGATKFLYDFASSEGTVFLGAFQKIIQSLFSRLPRSTNIAPQINMGDIIVNGNADDSTVSEIRREKRAEMQWILKEFNKMNKRS